MASKALYLIVEGDGEVSAVPLLVRHLLYEHLHIYDYEPKRPFNAHGRGNLTKPDGLEGFLRLTHRQSDCAGVLVLLDAEKENRDCPPELARHLADRARDLRLPFPVAIVCAACEYESWFLACLYTIAPRYLKPGVEYTGDPEHECNAKGWLSRHMPEGRIYKETQD